MTYRVCLRSKGGAGWIGGLLYIQNLSKAISMHAAKEGDDVHTHISGRFVDKVALRISKQLADRVRFLPTSLLNPWKYDFVYPDFAGARAPYRWGAWIPDLQELHLPHLFTDEDKRRRRYMCENAAKSAPVIVFSSQMACNDFLNLHPKAEAKCRILNFTSSPGPDWTAGDPIAVQAKYGLPDRFFLVSNQFWMHKDHGAVIDALGLLRREADKPVVVCTGALEDYRDPGYFGSLQKRIADAGVEDQIHILGLIPRLDQLQLMRRSLAVIQPSLFEGWSTVVEDARALGKVMLLSDFPVHLEQNPLGAQFFERSNAEQLASLMREAWSTLAPGPDLPSEAAALSKVEDLTLAFGRRFLEIARGD